MHPHALQIDLAHMLVCFVFSEEEEEEMCSLFAVSGRCMNSGGF